MSKEERALNYVNVVVNFFNNSCGFMTQGEIEELTRIIGAMNGVYINMISIKQEEITRINDYIEEDKGEEVYNTLMSIINDYERGAY